MNKKSKGISPAPVSAAAKHREGIESIIVAIMLALLFRSFEAEAFVIPTGSMAPTLQGRHRDIKCPQCGYRYQAGASVDEEGRNGPVQNTTCPMCRFNLRLDRGDANEGAFNGDRILVTKFAYQFWDPQRWDVIVFKYPGNAKQNYIKRLVGLPDETLRIHHGDVFVRAAGTEQFHIARKPPRKMLAMLQLVSDTRRIPQSMVTAQWPSSWADMRDEDGGWQISEDRQEYSLPATATMRWLRYRHLVPTPQDWQFLRRGNPAAENSRRRGELISDYYAYNDQGYERNPNPPRPLRNWVGDLAVECEAKIQGDQGTLSFDLVEAGDHFVCEIDVATGQATLLIDGGSRWEGADALVGQTSVRGSGRYSFRFSNVDDQLRLWVGRSLVAFTANGQPHSGSYQPGSVDSPQWSAQDPGDLLPVGVAGRGMQVTLTRLRVLRDIYYIAADSTDSQRPMGVNATDYRRPHDARQIQRIFADPTTWSTSGLFADRCAVEFELADEQYFPMGDNNPQSKDARLWAGPEQSLFDGQDIRIDHYVGREMLIGKAFYIYWPHGWNVANIRFPIVPNLPRMGRIR